MKISIITVCRNSGAVIQTAMESVLRQTWPDIEYLVVDGGSTDGTTEHIRRYEQKFGDRMRWVSERDSGMYDAINKGIRMATGDVVGILNADDVFSDDAVIARVAEVFRGRSGPVCGHGETAVSAPMPPLDVVYGDIRFVANKKDETLDAVRAEKTLRYYSARCWRPWMLQWGYMPPHPSVYVRRTCFDTLGVYSLNYQIAADYALLIRFLRRAHMCLAYVPMCFVDMRVGGASTKNWRSNLLLNQEIVRGNREAGYWCCLPMLVPKYLFKVWEFLLPKVKRIRLS